MTWRIRVTFSPPPRLLRRGVLPQQLEHHTPSYGEVGAKLQEIIDAGSCLLDMGSRLVIEVVQNPSE